jgi:hypothetical protein
MRGTNLVKCMNFERGNEPQKTAEFLRSELIALFAVIFR